MDTDHPTLRTPAAACLIAAPLALTAADLLQLSRSAPFGWTVVMWLAFVLFVPAIFALGHVARSRAPTLGVVAAAVTLVGAMAGASMQVLFRTSAVLESAALSVESRAAVEAALSDHPLLTLTTLVPGILFPLGLIFLGLLLTRHHLGARPATFLLVLGGVLFPMGHAAEVDVALIGGDLVLLVALSWLAREIQRRPELWSPAAYPHAAGETVPAAEPVPARA
ncbi:MAG TPA: hypothetical protein VF584_17285 [Longimicrobium sp.]|jgi:hypothetical protein